MRRRTREDLEATAREAEKTATLYQLALQDRLTDAVAKLPVKARFADGWTWTFYVSRLTAPCGGIVVVVGKVEGQTPCTAAWYLDDWLAFYDPRSRDVDPALHPIRSHLMTARAVAEGTAKAQQVARDGLQAVPS